MSVQSQDFFDIPSKQQPNLAPSPQSETDFFDIPYQPPPQKPGFFKEAERHIQRSISRAGEAVLGTPGNLLQLPEKAVKYIGEKLTGQKSTGFDEAMKIAKHLLPGGNLPSTEQVREQTAKISEGKLEPQNKAEEISDELVSDFASLAIPTKGKIPFLRALGLAVGTNLAGEGAEFLGASEEGKTATKVGSMFLLSAINPNGAKKYGDKLFKEAEAAIPKGATIPAANISASANKLKAELKKGGTAPYKTSALTKVNEIQNKIKKGRIAVDELAQFKIDINKARSSLYADVALDKGGRALAKRNLDSAARVVDDALKEYGKVNPTWEQLYRPANEVYGAIAQSKKVSNAIGRLIKQNPHTAGSILAGELFLAPKSVPFVIGGAGLLKTGELIARISKSKTLQKYYGEVVKAALKDDATTMIKYLNKLDAGLKKEE